MANNMSKLDGNQVLKSIFDPDDNSIKMANASSLVPESYDEIVLSYTGSDLTGVVYKKATVTVATLTLTYSASKLTHIVRS